MQIGDLKRAVEDVILKPDDNRLSDIGKRSSIAALDLCQIQESASTSRDASAVNAEQQYSAPPLTTFSCSGEMLSSPSGSTCSTSVTTSSGAQYSAEHSLTMSTSLDTMVLRHSLSSRPSLGTVRRSSRVLSHIGHGKRKRSNSVSSCLNKNMLAQPGCALSSSGISSTTTGGASAISLPPTARHTPFRCCDSEERSFPSILPDASIPSTVLDVRDTAETSYSESFVSSLCDLGDTPTAGVEQSAWLRKELNGPDASKVCSKTAHEIQQDALRSTQSSKVDTEGVRRSTGDFDVWTNRLSPSSSSFTGFRQPARFCDSDNDEQMECD